MFPDKGSVVIEECRAYGNTRWRPITSAGRPLQSGFHCIGLVPDFLCIRERVINDVTQSPHLFLDRTLRQH